MVRPNAGVAAVAGLGSALRRALCRHRVRREQWLESRSEVPFFPGGVTVTRKPLVIVCLQCNAVLLDHSGFYEGEPT